MLAQDNECSDRLARLIAAAESVWDDPQDAQRWLNKPHSQLDDKAPLQAGMTEAGARRAEALLNQILHGLPA